MDPNVAALVAYPGRFRKEIFGQMYKELNLTADGIRVLNNIKNSVVMPRLRIGKGWKPYTGDFVPTPDQLKYSDRTLSVERAQRDIIIDTEKYRLTYLSEQQSGSAGTNSNKAGQLPFEAWTWGELAKEGGQSLSAALYNGVAKAAFTAYNAGTAYSVNSLVAFVNTTAQNETQYYKVVATTTAGQTPISHPAKFSWVGELAMFTGFGKIITDEIALGFNQIVSTGAITVADAVSQFKNVFRIQHEQIKASGALVYCSYNNFEKLMDAMSEKEKYLNKIDDVVYLPETNRKAIVKPVSWLGGSNRLICTPANNLTVGTEQLEDMNKITIQPNHYKIEASMSFLFGTQIADLDVLTINDQA